MLTSVGDGLYSSAWVKNRVNEAVVTPLTKQQAEAEEKL